MVVTHSLLQIIYYFSPVPIRTKRLVVDKHMEVERFEEEQVQIRKEMLSFITFYTNDVLTSLKNQLLELDDKAKIAMQGTFGDINVVSKCVIAKIVVSVAFHEIVCINVFVLFCFVCLPPAPSPTPPPKANLLS